MLVVAERLPSGLSGQDWPQFAFRSRCPRRYLREYVRRGGITLSRDLRRKAHGLAAGSVFVSKDTDRDTRI